MSDAPSSTDRPQQATLGAGMVVGAAALHVLGSFDNMSKLRSIETKDRVAEALKAADGGLGINQEQMLQLMHAGLLVSAAAATAAIFLGVMAFRRDRMAPRVLIGLSALIVIGSLMFDPLWGMFVAGGTALLWSGPARDWFAGREIRPSRMELAMNRPRDERPEGEQSGSQSPKAPQWPAAADEPPRGTEPPAPTLPPAQDQPEPHASPYGQPQQPPSQTPQAPPAPQPSAQAPAFGLGATQAMPVHDTQRGRRPSVPGGVRTAGLVTLVASGLAFIGLGLTLVALITARSEVIAEIERAIRTEPRLDQLPAGFGADELARVAAVTVVVMLIWSAIAMVLGVLVMRGHNWARIVLVVSAAVTALICLLGMPATIVHALAAVVVVILLVLPQANNYFRSVGPAASAQGQHPPYAQQPPTFIPAPPREQDPKRDEDGKPPVW